MLSVNKNGVRAQTADESGITPGFFAWHDLISSDVEESIRFYNRVLGWESARIGSQTGGSRTVFLSDGRPVAGIAELQSSDQLANKWIPFVTVDNVKSALERAEHSGCRIATNAVPYPEFGRLGAVADNAGAAFAVIEDYALEDEIEKVIDDYPGTGRFCWEEIVTDSPQSAAAFYSAVFGWQYSDADEMVSGATQTLRKGDRAVAGIQRVRAGLLKPFWLSFVAVDDIDETTAQVGANGGEVLMAPISAGRDEKLALIKDSKDGVFAVMVSG